MQSTLDYRWSGHFITGMSYHLSASKPDLLSDAQGRYVSKRSDKPDSSFTSKNRSTVKRTLDAHAYTDWRIDTSGKKVSLDVGYLDQQNHSEGSLSSALFVQKHSKHRDTISNTLAGAFNPITFSTDVQLPYKKFKLSFGGKLSSVHAKNDFREYQHEKDKSSLNAKASNTFDYTEDTQALYGDKDWDKLSLKLGLRLENTQTKGESPNSATDEPKRVQQALPNALHKLQDKR